MSNKKKIKVKKHKEPEKVDNLTQTIRDSLNTVGRKVDPYQEQLLVQVVKSFLVGGVATIVDFILFIILVLLIKLNPLISNIISFIIIFIFSYFMSKKYVFNKNKDVKEFIILMITNLVFTEVLLYLLVIIVKLNPILIKLLAIILVIVLKILIRRFIFNKKTSRK